MIQIYPQYEGLISVWSIGRLGSITTFDLPQDTYSKVFPIPQTPSILRNARLFSGGFSITPLQGTGVQIPPLQSTDGIPIYTTSMKKLREGYRVGTLSKGSLFNTYF